MKTHAFLRRAITSGVIFTLSTAAWTVRVHGQDKLDATTVESSVTLGPLITYIQPGPQPTAYVASGTHVTLVAMQDAPAGATVEWYLSGERVAGDANELEIGLLTHSGKLEYQAYVVGAGGERTARAVDLIVIDPLKRSRLANVSTRVRITRDTPVVISGFVVESQARPDVLGPRRLLIRAVGPTLADLGVAQPLADPMLEIFLADGTRYEWPVEAAVIDPSRDPAALAVIVGAFPLSAAGGDFAAAPALEPGAYTLHVSSRSGGEGDVLVEVYEIPGI